MTAHALRKQQKSNCNTFLLVAKPEWTRTSVLGGLVCHSCSLKIKIYFQIRKEENPHIFWSSVRPCLLPYSVKLLFLLRLMDAAIISHICPFEYVSTAFATCKRCRNSGHFSSRSKVICLNFIPS